MLPVTKITAPKLLSSWLKYEVYPDYTREVGTLLAGTGGPRRIMAGQLVAVSGGKLVAWDPAGSDGSEIVVGVALADCEAAEGADHVGGLLYLARGPALVFAPELVWPAGITAAQKTTAVAALVALGILARSA